MIPAFPVYLFDVDGTLLDSAQDICGAVQQVLTNAGSPPFSFDYLRSYIGLHLNAVIGDSLPHCTPDQIEELIQQYRVAYVEREHRETAVFPGVAEALAVLGGRKSTATTKGTKSSRAVLEKFGLLQYFDHVQGTDRFPAKPAPDVIFASLKELGAAPADCLMVGDSASDMEAGRSAGVKTCAVRYGYGAHQEMARFEPDYWIDDLRALLPAASLVG